MPIKGSLQPTYEGLKLYHSWLSLLSRCGLQPTYEGLKPDLVLEALCHHLSLQPTYEGLKQSRTNTTFFLPSTFAAYL